MAAGTDLRRAEAVCADCRNGRVGRNGRRYAAPVVRHRGPINSPTSGRVRRLLSRLCPPTVPTSLLLGLPSARTGERYRQDSRRPTAQAVVSSLCAAVTRGSAALLSTRKPAAGQLVSPQRRDRSRVPLQRLSKPPKEQHYFSQALQRSTDSGQSSP